MNGWIPVLCVLVPLLGACALPFAGKRSPKIRNALALALVAAAFAFSLASLPAALAGEPLAVRVKLPLGLSFGLVADALAVFMALTSSLVAAVIVIYSFGYVREYDNQNEYYMMVVLFIGAMMGLVHTTNLIFLYMFWELSAVCCWRLIGFYREEIAVARANKAYFVTVAGALVMLAGFLGIYAQTGTFDLEAMKGFPLPAWAVVLILFGILSKSATFPLHSWLPDAGVAPSPVTSLLHAAVLVKIGVFAYARLFVGTFVIPEIFALAVPVIAALSALLSAGLALRANDIKRVIAYSTVSQLAFILLGISSGTEEGFVGGLLYILAHAVAKGGLFLCAGIVEHSVHTKDITKMGGLAKRFPLTAIAFALCAASVMGIPPFSGFFAKYLVIDGMLAAGHPLLAAVFIIGAVMTVLYLARLFAKVFLGPPAFPDAKEGTSGMVASVVALAALALLLGLAINLPGSLAALIWEAM
ncbi:MAG TPA: proton-conducting transporter membrane subunit [Clostridia bacterium]|nr:MAG: Na(+)/H(+) antiporter subunit A [Firmicutes bacterium ADurb.Bin248]HOG00292.1 proton-conducting transporter membrane subunit [Clostridia bacterium]HOS17690.1 proton-conducting transporter membrane subunit [Clostridia bacterium]HPK15765.1 proton-conducting transporter membrane subunit [Clostridia bacterium]